MTNSKMHKDHDAILYIICNYFRHAKSLGQSPAGLSDDARRGDPKNVEKRAFPH